MRDRALGLCVPRTASTDIYDGAMTPSPGPPESSSPRRRLIARRRLSKRIGTDPRWGQAKPVPGVPESTPAPGPPKRARSGPPKARGRHHRFPLSRPAQRVKLGGTRSDGISPSLRALIERGVELHPGTARKMSGRIVIRFREAYSPVRIQINSRTIKVEDGDLRKPDVTIIGSLPDIIAVAAAPQVAGIPSPMTGRGLSAIGLVARGQVQFSGDTALARRLLRLLSL